MTAEEYIEKMKDPRWYGEQDENGVDLSLIRANLKLSPEERLRKGDQATTQALQRKTVSVASTPVTTHPVGNLQLCINDPEELIAVKKRAHQREIEESLAYLLAIKRIREETGLR